MVDKATIQITLKGMKRVKAHYKSLVKETTDEYLSKGYSNELEEITSVVEILEGMLEESKKIGYTDEASDFLHEQIEKESEEPLFVSIETFELPDPPEYDESFNKFLDEAREAIAKSMMLPAHLFDDNKD